MNAGQAPFEDSSASPELAQTPLVQLGRCLRDARLGRQQSLSSLAAQLRMGEEQLQALEDGDQARLPETVFVIAQARRVADALHVDINALIAPIKQQGFAINPAPAPLSDEASGTNRREQRRPARLTAQHYTQNFRANRNRAGAAAGRILGSLALLAGVAAAGSWGWQQIRPLPNRPQSPPAATAAKPAAVKPATDKPAAAKPAPAKPAQPLVPPGQLQLSSNQPSWVDVRTSAGQSLFEGTLQGQRSFPLAKGLKVRAGRPDLVSARVGDQPAKVLGTIDQIRWVNFPAEAAPSAR